MPVTFRCTHTVHIGALTNSITRNSPCSFGVATGGYVEGDAGMGDTRLTPLFNIADLTAVTDGT